MEKTRRFHKPSDLVCRAAKEKSKVRTMAGHAAVTGKRSSNLGYFFEIMEPGCFKDALADPDLECYSLFNHDESLLLGATANGELRMEEDKDGLYQETDLKGDTTDSANMIAHLDAGRITKMSFAFTIAPDGQEWDEDKDGLLIRTVTRVQRLYDVSPVTYPAYPQTDIGIRSAQEYNEIMGLLVRAENGLKLNREGLLAIKDFSARLEKIVNGVEPEAAKPEPKGVTVDSLRRRFHNLR